MRFILLICLSMMLAQCSSSKTKNVVVEEESLVEESVVEKSETDGGVEDHPCYPGRAKIKTFENQEATIVTVIGRPMIFFDYTRLDPCEIPDEFTTENLKVVVSGDTYATPPNVRVAGQPFVIRSIRLIEQ